MSDSKIPFGSHVRVVSIRDTCPARKGCRCLGETGIWSDRSPNGKIPYSHGCLIFDRKLADGLTTHCSGLGEKDIKLVCKLDRRQQK